MNLDDDPPEALEVAVQYGGAGARIVISASCDLDARSFPHLLLAPVYEVSEASLKSQSAKDHRRRAEALRSGLLPRHYPLAEYPPLDFPRSFASWHDIVMLPRAYVLANTTGPRLRLKHPYREQFGNWVGRRMSEVGPEDETQIPRDSTRPQPHHLTETAESLEEIVDEQTETESTETES